MKKELHKFGIMTLGCKVNQFESDALSQAMIDKGWVLDQKDSGLQVCIINTCTVTQKAAMQSRQAIRQAIRAHPDARIIVTGCYAQIAPDEIAAVEGIDAVIGNTDKYRIADMVETNAGNGSERPQILCDDIMGVRQFQPMPTLPHNQRTRAFLKIQDGCNAFCTYCIVPYARGTRRSMPFQDVIEAIRELKKKGFHEIVLTGIHLGNYGVDLNPQTTLTDLLVRIQQSNLMERVRLSSIEPQELTDDIIQLVADSQCICDHFHVPLQSGDDRILKRMNRSYSGLFFQERTGYIRRILSQAAIGADVLVGFPGETDDAFENTYTIIEKSPVTYLHVFPFSARKGTPAFSFPDRVPPDVIHERCRRLRVLGKKKQKDFYKSHRDHGVEILVESTRDKSTNMLKGFTSNYISVLINEADELKNKLINVKIDRITEQNQVFGIFMK